jgi:hypothetical protein
VRLERDRDCFRASHPSAPHDFAEHIRMRAMHAIEISHANDRGADVRGNFIEVVEDLHRGGR